MDHCTFRPYVSPKSTKIAYNLVTERHLRANEFIKDYLGQNTEHRDDIPMIYLGYDEDDKQTDGDEPTYEELKNDGDILETNP